MAIVSLTATTKLPSQWLASKGKSEDGQRRRRHAHHNTIRRAAGSPARTSVVRVARRSARSAAVRAV